MRLFTTLEEAAFEIKRDLYKSPKMEVSRVQQRHNLDIAAREAVGMTYAITPGGIPETAAELVALGLRLEMPMFVKEPEMMERWLQTELEARCYPHQFLGRTHEGLHPALSTCLEGDFPSYTYAERMMGAQEALVTALTRSPDTRRAYWPIFRPEDAFRAAAPTRIPCSLGYEMVIRHVNGVPRLNVVYLQRSADFDTFWLSDVWFAHKYREFIRSWLAPLNDVDIESGATIHHIISFHSFFAADSEVY